MRAVRPIAGIQEMPVHVSQHVTLLVLQSARMAVDKQSLIHIVLDQNQVTSVIVHWDG